MVDEWLEQRLANRLPKDHPDYDAFYDATDTELADMLPPAPTDPSGTEKE